MIQRGLAGATRQTVRTGGVLAVLDDVEVEAAKFLHAEVVHLLVDVPETVGGVSLLDLALQQQRTVDRPAVQRDQLIIRHHVLRRVEAVEVGEQEACGVADTPVGIGAALQDLLGYRHLAGIVGGRHPQTQDVGAHAVGDFLRRDDVAEGLRHLAAVLVHGESVGQQPLVRRMTVDGRAGQQRGVEPAAMLIGTFQIEIGTRAALVAHGVRTAHHMPMGGAGIEPDIQGIGDLFVLRRFVAKQFGSIQLRPGLDTALLHTLCHLLHQLDGARVQLAVFLVQEERDRHAPDALARDTPVRTSGDHAVQARLPPGRDEFGLFDGIQRTAAQRAAIVGDLVHADEPLRRGAVDQRGLVPPAVHVAVLDRLVLEQRADLGELLDDGRVGLPDELATKERQIGDVDAVALHRAENVVILHAVVLAGAEVILAVSRRRVDDTGTGTGFHVIGQIDRSEALVERMTEADQLQRLAFATGDDFTGQAVALQTGLHQLFGQHQHALTGVHQRIDELGVHVQRLVGRDGPGRSGPDDDAGALDQAGQAERGGQLVGVLDIEGDVDGIRFLVLIFDFRLGQRRTTVEAPVHRLQALEDEAAFHQFGQGADFPGFVGEVHGLVRVVPVTQNAEADEVGLLPLDLLGRIGTATLAGQIGRLVLAEGGLDLVLDRQTVAVPTRHVGSVETGQGARADDHVLDHLVHRVANVNIAVGIRRAIVQDELRATFADLPQLPVQVNAVPALQNLRLALWQTGLHRKCRGRQIEGRFVIGHFSPDSS